MWFTGEQAIKEGVALAFQQMFSTTGEWRPSLNGLVFEGLRINLEESELILVGRLENVDDLLVKLRCRKSGLVKGCLCGSDNIFPKVVPLRLEWIQRNFLWGNGTMKHNPHLVKWAVVCRDKRKGGLRIKSFALLNNALLCKWSWRDRVSFRSPSPSPKAFRSTVASSENPHCSQKTLTTGDFFRRSPFRHRSYHQVRKEEIFKFCQSIRGRISVTCRPRRFLLRRPKPHASVHEGTWSTFRQRASTSSLA
ncbi:hypothetical protein CK203_048290 [Vitis vinifera]|uniref:Uncharacterized protein n=1 Tax=Vitis vinifera TaxID=29760 RepID=A0A438H0A8_VITVI|nr:hypothetical protein CK203_048290 [Vitis vinifera]